MPYPAGVRRGAAGPVEQWPLIGRETEIDLLARALRAPSGGSVVLVGPPGVGKTRLAMEAIDLATVRGRVCVRAVASRAAATIPLGALAPILPVTVSGEGGRPDLTSAGLQALAAAGGERGRAVLFVDDAQLLDNASAVVVHQAVATGIVTLIATIRTGEPVSETVSTLWKDDRCRRVDLGPLDRAAVDALVPAVLGGPVEGATLHRLWAATGGNVLFLRELVMGAFDAALLVEDGGLWRLRGSLAASARLNELLLARLASSTPAETRVLELLAVGEPIGLALLVRLADADAVEALERRGLISVSTEGRRHATRLAHPLYGELLRDRQPAIATLRANRVLADAVEGLGARRREDVVRVAVWRLDGGGEAKPDLMLAAGRLAYAGRELDVCERLARSAWDAGGGLAAGLLRSSALAELGREDEADGVLAELAHAAATDDDRALIALRRSVHLLWALGRAGEAASVVDEAEAAVHDPNWRDELRAQRANLRALAGDPGEALRLGAGLLSASSDRVVVRASTGATIALAAAGRFDEALSTAGRAWKRQQGMSDQRGFGSAGFHIVLRALVLADAGRVGDAQVVAARAYDVAVQSGDVVGQRWTSLALARAVLAQGRLCAAARWANEATVLFGDAHQPDLMRWSIATRLLAVAQQADAPAVAAAAVELDAVASGGLAFLDADVDRALAWHWVARGDLAAARSGLVAAADRWVAVGAVASAVIIANELTRLGATEAAAEILGRIELPVGWLFGSTVAAHVLSAANGDAAGLEAAATAFADHGMDLLAAETTAAAAVWRARGSARTSRRLALRADELAAQCEGARTPALARAGEAGLLSRREQEVAMLASQGHTNRSIAEQLSLSERTVENHLQRVYFKLGIAARHELPVVLGIGVTEGT